MKNETIKNVAKNNNYYSKIGQMTQVEQTIEKNKSKK
jgi:hypothetical protein